MTEDFAKKIDDFSGEESVSVEGQDHPKWNRKDSGVRRVKSLLPDGEPARVSHVKMTSTGADLLTEEEFLEFWRLNVRERINNTLVGSKLELKQLVRRMEVLKRRIGVLDPLVERLEEEYGIETIPAKSADVEIEKGTLSVEAASEFLLAGFNERRGRVVCAGIQKLTFEGVEMIASWHGMLRFPDMSVSDFDEDVRHIFLCGNVDSVFAGDGPVMTRGDKKDFQEEESL